MQFLGIVECDAIIVAGGASSNPGEATFVSLGNKIVVQDPNYALEASKDVLREDDLNVSKPLLTSDH